MTNTIQIRLPAEYRSTQLERFAKYVDLIPEAAGVAVIGAHLKIRERIIKSAKRRAPRYTGWLRRSIKEGETNMRKSSSFMEIRVDASYGIYHEAQPSGFTPHFVPWRASELNRGFVKGNEVLTNSRTRPNASIRKYMKDGGIDPALSPGIYVSRARPFLRPAMFRVLRAYYAHEVRSELRKKLNVKPGQLRNVKPNKGGGE